MAKEVKNKAIKANQVCQIKYAHINVIAKNWQKLANFYIKVFNCQLVSPKRNLCGKWLEMGTGVKGANIQGVHLRLPCHGDNGPTLEIHQYKKFLYNYPPAVNRKGFSHIAFEVVDVKSKLREVMSAGGHKIGGVASKIIDGVGVLTFVCVADPEGNIIELQHWDKD